MAEAEKGILYENSGYKIRLEPRSFTFGVISPEGGFLRDYPTFEAAEKWIVNELRVEAKKERRVLNLSAITDQGEEVLILGVNVNTGRLKTTTDSNFDGTLYPNTPRMKELIIQLRDARDRCRLIGELLHHTGFMRYTYGKLESANYEGYLKAIEERFAKCVTAVEQIEEKERLSAAAVAKAS